MSGFSTHRLPRAAPARVLACGAWLKNSACLLDGDTLICSPVHGDLGGPDSRAALLRSVMQLRELARGPLDAVAHDLHPDFYSTQVAQRLAHESGVSAIAVQHHHAHLAVVQAEHGMTGPFVGLALDGVGLGDDGHAWGGEVLALDGPRCERVAHLPELPLPGGDVAAREPWRMAAAALHRLGRGADIELLVDPDGTAPVSAAAARTVRTLLERQINSPPTTSAGRWFDAAAGLLGVCLVQSEEAQAAIALERLAAQWLAQHPVPVESAPPASAPQLLDDMLDGLWQARQRSRDADTQAQGAARFHVALAQALAALAQQAARQARVQTVAMGGGCFFNSVLRQRLLEHLAQAGLQVKLPQAFNLGDAGLAVGQAWAAALQFDAATAAEHNERSTACV